MDEYTIGYCFCNWNIYCRLIGLVYNKSGADFKVGFESKGKRTKNKKKLLPLDHQTAICAYSN